MACALDLPVNIPWKLIAASPDMMDTKFCNKLFPFAWRSSLALSVYEPSLDDLPDGLCGQRLTYLKLTCSITGYQPSKGETGQIVAQFPDQPTEDQRAVLERILAEYFACYGVLLNVALFPGLRKVTKDVTIDFASIKETKPGSTLPNPYVNAGLKFEVSGAANNRLVDIYPASGDGHAELDLHKSLVVTFPPGMNIGKVAAQVAHYNASGVTMEAFSAGNSVGSQTAPAAPNILDSLTIEADHIDQVIFTAIDNKASLLKFTYSIVGGETDDTTGIALDDFPHVIDFEPKLRDLYQAATDTGEVLSDSKSGLKTDKSFTQTDSTQNSMSLGVKAPIPGTSAVGEASTTHSSTDTDQTQWAVQADASRERRETQSTSTQISQMYNLLTGYHIGTNRAVFLMLARPHVLQPTDFRTFVQGLRAIEGVQEFFLIVSRPLTMEGLCIEASLETGHFPEDAAITQPAPKYDESFEDFTVTKSAPSGVLAKDSARIDMTYTIGAGWVVDRSTARGPDPGHPGMKMLQDNSNSQATDTLTDYNYLPASDSSVMVQGEISGSRSPFADDASFNRSYRVFTRSEQPKTSAQQPSADVGRLVITSRELCVCFRSTKGCPEVEPRPGHRDLAPDKSIVDEPVIRINPLLLSREANTVSRGPAVKAFLKQIERSMSNSWRLPGRNPPGEVGFLDSETFKEQIKSVVPPDILRKSLGSLTDVPAKLVGALGTNMTVAEALNLDLAGLVRKGGVTLAEAVAFRQKLLRIRH